MEGISDTVAAAIRAEVARGQYRRDARAGASWAGKLVGRQLNFEIDAGVRRPIVDDGHGNDVALMVRDHAGEPVKQAEPFFGMDDQANFFRFFHDLTV